MRLTAVFLAVVAAASPLEAQSSSLATAIAAGKVGERYDGYMGAAIAPSEELRRQVAAVNLRRRNLYIELATQRGVTANVVGLTAACELFTQLSPGEAYMLKDGAWHRTVPGQPAPRPDHCR